MKKKLLLFMALIFSMIFSANAQIATQNSKLLDNVYVGASLGVTTPLDFNSMFPVNTTFGLKVGKEFTPVFGLEAEGTLLFNDNHFTDLNTWVKVTNVGVNSVFNLSNLVFGYNGNPRLFEVKTNTGIGWLHNWNAGENSLTGKTGLDLYFNLGKSKTHSIVISPAVYWNLKKFNEIQFNKNGGQLSLSVGYIYHFKTSNGTHHFKTYDIGALIEENKRLTEELQKKPTEVVRDVVKEVEVVKTNVITVSNKYVVLFGKGSSELTDTAKSTLDEVPQNVDVIVEATASPEGLKSYNKKLSQKRADNVAKYLKERGVNVIEANGLGTTGKDSQRVAVVTIKQ